MRHYVYAHTRLDTKEVVYIGKGMGSRFKYMGKYRNSDHVLIYKTVGLEFKILEYFKTDEEALFREVELIKKYKDLNQCVANKTLGGENYGGTSEFGKPRWPGYCYTPKRMYKDLKEASEDLNIDRGTIWRRVKSKFYPDWFVTKDIIMIEEDPNYVYEAYEEHHKIGTPLSETTKLKISKSSLGKSAWNLGIPHEESTIIKIRKALQGKEPYNKGVHDIICTPDACFYTPEGAMEHFKIAKSTVHLWCRLNKNNWYKIKEKVCQKY